MTPERYFFMYAFPCAYIKLERGEISKEEYDELEKKFLNKGVINKQDLERIFSPAFVWIKKIAEREKKDVWDLDVIYEYWNKEHNELIDRGEGVYANHPEILKDLCRIHDAEIIKKENNILFVRYNGEERVVFNNLVPLAEVGDKVKIHYAKDGVHIVPYAKR